MNVLVVSYGNLNYDGRLRELIDVASRAGSTISITAGTESEYTAIDNGYIYSGQSFIGFIKFCIRKARGIRGIDVLIVDNRRAVIPSLLIKKRICAKCVVQDVRELYLMNEVGHLTGKIGCLVERYLIKRADLLLCANDYRAEIMKKIYGLKTRPTVFENYRMLSFSEKYRQEEYDKKYSKLFTIDSMKLISTSGCSVFRTNDRLVRELTECSHSVELFLVGDSSREDEQVIRRILAENKMSNVHILGRLGEDELKYLIIRCDIGIVNYGKQDQNNIYCASGKIFEFLFEGKPVVTTTNPPLKAMCDKYQIGVSGDSYSAAIDAVIQNYDFFQMKVREYISSIDIDSNNQMVAEKIIDLYHAKTGDRQG